jgi:hypothetical protein
MARRARKPALVCATMANALSVSAALLISAEMVIGAMGFYVFQWHVGRIKII